MVKPGVGQSIVKVSSMLASGSSSIKSEYSLAIIGLVIERLAIANFVKLDVRVPCLKIFLMVGLTIFLSLVSLLF